MKQLNYFPKHITTYWWNFGSKKKDFEGSVSEFLKEKSIRVSEVKNPKIKNMTGVRFKINFGGAIITFDSFDNHQDAALMAVKIFLSWMGDKARIVTGNRNININH